MADKKGKTTKNARLWAGNELELFAEFLADPENNFAICLEKLAIKKSGINAIFEHINYTLKMDNG